MRKGGRTLGNGINRIRLEFKESRENARRNAHFVLIESDWNLKLSCNDFLGDFCHGINRIRLEFKVSSVIIRERLDRCINRIILEFKGYFSGFFSTASRCINRIILEFKDYLII